jgi:hypothetical protein
MSVTNQDIHDKLQGIEDAIVGGVKKVVVFPLWVKIVAGVGLITLVILLITVFKKHDAPNQDYLKEMAAKDTLIKYQQGKIDALIQGQSLRDSVIFPELLKISGNKETQTRIIHEYEKIPSVVNNLDREELRKQVTEY